MLQGGAKPAATSAATPPISVAARRTGLLDHSIFWLFVTGLAWVPFWHGSNEAIAWGINAVLFPGLAILYETGLVVRGKPHPVGLHAPLPVALFLLLVLWIGLQSAAEPVPDAANPAWQMASEGIGGRVISSISVNRDLTAAALVRLITGASVFWLALQLCRDAGRAWALIASIALVGAAYAAYGLIAAETGWLRMPDMLQSNTVSAMFINPDSYAAFAGIGFIATSGIFFRLCRRRGVGALGNSRSQIAALIEIIGRDGAPVLAGGFIILAALFLTSSRGGIAATGLSLIASAVLVRRSAAGRKAGPWPVLMLGVLFVGGTGGLFGAALFEKIADLGFFDANRLAIYRLTLQSIFDQPWLGWGYGTFIDVFPMYRDLSIAGWGTWSQAHNTYLEALQGLGVIFGSMFIVLVALLAFRCFKGAASRRENAMVPLIAVGAAILVGVHALIDFSLQIQAVALTVSALLGAGIAQAESSRVTLKNGSAGPVHGADAQPKSIGAGWQSRLTILVVLALCAYAAIQGWDLAFSAARARGADETRLGSISGAIPGAARSWLGIPGLSHSAFDLPLAQIALIDPETGEQHAAVLTALVAARPLSSQAWLSLAVFRLVAREKLASVLAALRLSWLTGPNEGSMFWQRGVFGLALWDFLPIDARERTTQDLARALTDHLVADRQLAAIKSIFGTKSAETRAQIRALLEKDGLQPVDLAHMGLLSE